MREKLRLAALTQTTLDLSSQDVLLVFAMLECALNYRDYPDKFHAPFNSMLDQYKESK